MAVPSSGQISMLQIIDETGLRPTNISLRNLSNIAGFSTPDKITDFYGYSQTDAERYKNAVTNTGHALSGAEDYAIDILFSDLDSYGLYSEIYGFYPMIGGGQAQALNAKSVSGVRQWALDLTFYGGWSFGAYGATGNASNTYWTANYSYNSTTIKSSHLGTYITDDGTYSYGWDIGIFDSYSNYPYAFMTMYDGSSGYLIYDYDYSDGINYLQPQNYSGNNMMSYDNTNSGYKYYQNSNITAFVSSGTEAFSNPTYIVGGYDYYNNYYTDKTFGFLTFGNFLGGSQMLDYQNIINTFQTTLGRNTY
jgi:hypothetical protein